MEKSKKELAFLRDLYIAPDWTQRFTELFDKNFKFADEKEILYVNPGSGNHVLELRERLGVDSRIDAYGENEESNILARGKAEMVGSDIIFSDEFPRESYDLVIADGSFVPPGELDGFLEEVIDLSDATTAFFLPTAGSFGEIFSMLWEAFLNADLEDQSQEVENLVTAIPQITRVQEMVQRLGLKDIKVTTAIDVFEYSDGIAFINAPLVADFLLPVWLRFLNEEERERVSNTLVELIETDRDGLTFRFTVKATLFTGEKN